MRQFFHGRDFFVQKKKTVRFLSADFPRIVDGNLTWRLFPLKPIHPDKKADKSWTWQVTVENFWSHWTLELNAMNSGQKTEELLCGLSFLCQVSNWICLRQLLLLNSGRIYPWLPARSKLCIWCNDLLEIPTNSWGWVFASHYSQELCRMVKLRTKQFDFCGLQNAAATSNSDVLCRLCCT